MAPVLRSTVHSFSWIARRSRLGPMLTLLLVAAAPPLSAQEGRPIVRSYAARETGGDAFTWTTVQDERGVLYVGSNAVLSFDGERWRRHPVPGGNTTRALSVGRNGRLWVGATNQIGYFERVPDGLGPFQSLLSGRADSSEEFGDVWQVFARGEGAVFVTTRAVLIWDGKSLRRHDLPGARRLAGMQSGEEIFVYHASSGLWRVQGDELQPLIRSESLGTAGVLWMEPREQGWLLATTEGLFTYRAGEDLAPLAPAASAYMREHVLTAACRLHNGDLAIGTLKGGLLVLDDQGAIKRTVGPDEGLPSRSVFSIYEDALRQVWVTSGSGVAQLSLDGSVTLFDAQSGLKAKPVLGTLRLGTEVLAATSEGVFRLSPAPGAATRVAPVPELPERYVDFALLPDGAVLAAGYKSVDRWKDGVTTRELNVTFDAGHIRPVAGQSEAVWITDGADLLHYDLRTKTGTLVARLDELPTSLVEGPDRQLWVGTSSHGARSLQLPQKVPLRPTFANVPASIQTGASLVARLGQSLVIATDQGPVVLRSGRDQIEPLAGAPRTPGVAVSNPDAEHSVWLAQASPFTDGAGGAIVGKLTEQADGSVTWQAFALPHLAQAGVIFQLNIDAQQVLWISGSEGLLRYDVSLLRPVRPPRAPLITSPVPDASIIPAERNTVGFDFATLEFTRRDALRFQTRLGPTWSEPTNNPHLTLAGLGDGHYELAVRVLNDAGQASPVSTWRFTVLPPWYRTLPAIGAWIALALAAVAGGVRWRLAYLRRRNALLEALIQRKTEQLEKANAAKAEFIANMSHEIRNPISGILGLSVALEDTRLDAPQRRISNSIRSCARLLATLVDDVLDFAKIDAGKIELRPAPFDLPACLDECVAMVEEEARAQNCRMLVAAAPELPRQVIGDIARVQQILLNYLSNALKFGDGQPILLGSAPGRHGRIRLFVRDQGPGIEAAEVNRLFTQFTRLDRARNDGVRGTGLGLAVCKRLAGKLAGEVGVDSTPGEGACFWVELPLPAHAPADRAAAPVIELKPLRALVVEDIDYNATAMQAVLHRFGIESDVANDGPTALDRLQRHPYDLAFVDWSLPGIIGTEVVSRYRAVEPPGRRTIIIATTAYSADFNREACLRAGMDAFMAKPFTPEKVAHALKELRGMLPAAAPVELKGATAGEDPLAGVDLQMLRFLSDGTPAGFAAQITRFLAAVEEDRAKMPALLDSGSPADIHRLAHRLAAHTSLIKAHELSLIAATLQARAALDSRDQLRLLFADYENGFATLRCKLEGLRSSVESA